MYTLIIVIHVIACLILIAVILFQSGRGGGLSDLFSGGGSQTIFGVRTPKFLTQATTAAAVVFLITCVSLTILSSKRVRSLMTGVKPTGVVVPQPLTAPSAETTGVHLEIEKQPAPQPPQEQKPQEAEKQPKEAQQP